jgi:glycine hydroxymethyltransferase
MFSKIYEILKKEDNRSKSSINLVASENLASQDVLDFCSISNFSNKYAEGIPGKRFYAGCEYYDELERLVQNECCKLFDAEYANVQLHSGTQANQAALMALMKPGDKLLSMDFSAGGHLSHGHKLSLISQLYNVYMYNVDRKTEVLDYDEVLNIAKKVAPKVIIAGASSYSRLIDYKSMRQIADEVNAYLLADIAHIAGLIASRVIPGPVKYADVVTFTTHKTLRGVRGGVILCKEKFTDEINRSVMPGVQGGPHMNMVVGKAATFIAASTEEFKSYSENVVKNANIMAKEFVTLGCYVVSGGTDNHLFVVDTVRSFGKTGLECEKILESKDIIVNRNAIPFDNLSPAVSSGIRIGTPYMTSYGYDEFEFKNIIPKIIGLLE